MAGSTGAHASAILRTGRGEGVWIMVRGVILDVDGTLVLSNDAHARAWVQAFAEYDYEVPFERVRPLIGAGSDRLLAVVVPGLREDEGDGRAIAERRKEIFLNRYLDTLEPAPGARALVRHMRDSGMRLVVASSAKPDELHPLLESAHVADSLDVAATPDEVNESKPAPDVVSAALRKLGLEPGEVIMIGDTSYDVDSARASGVRTIALRCGGASDDRLAGACAIYDDPEDLLAHYTESPLAQLEPSPPPWLAATPPEPSTGPAPADGDAP
jgi:HAD superfamily hydrolase (TIGR01509 family)